MHKVTHKHVMLTSTNPNLTHCNTKVDTVLNVQLAFFHTVKMNSDQSPYNLFAKSY